MTISDHFWTISGHFWPFMAPLSIFWTDMSPIGPKWIEKVHKRSKKCIKSIEKSIFFHKIDQFSRLFSTFLEFWRVMGKRWPGPVPRWGPPWPYTCLTTHYPGYLHPCTHHHAHWHTLVRHAPRALTGWPGSFWVQQSRVTTRYAKLLKPLNSLFKTTKRVTFYSMRQRQLTKSAKVGFSSVFSGFPVKSTKVT